MTCADCGRPMRHYRQSVTERPDTIRHYSRGLCKWCWVQAKRAGALAEFPSQLRAWDLLLEDYAMLRDEGHRLRDIAERLGVSYDALDQALLRHRDDPRARRPITSTPNQHTARRAS